MSLLAILLPLGVAWAGEAPTIYPIFDAFNSDLPQVKLAVAPKVGRFATATRESGISIREVENGRLRRQLLLPELLSGALRLSALALAPDGRTVAIAGWTQGDNKRQLQLVDAGTDRVLFTTDLGEALLHTLCFAPDGWRLAGLAWGGGGLRLFRVDDGRMVAEDRGYGAEGVSCDFAADGRLVTTSQDGMIRLYDQELRKLADLPAPGGKLPSQAAFSPDGRQIAIGYADAPQVSLHDAKTLSLLRYTPTVNNGTLAAVAWTTDGANLLLGGRWRDPLGNYPVRIWSLKNEGKVVDLPFASAPIARLVAGMDDELFAITGDGRLVETNIQGDMVLNLWNPLPTITALPTQAGNNVLVDGEGWNVRYPYRRQDGANGLLQIALRKRLLQEIPLNSPLDGFQGASKAVSEPPSAVPVLAIDHSGSLYVVADPEGGVSLWKLSKESGIPEKNVHMRGERSVPRGVATFSADGTWFALAGIGGSGKAKGAWLLLLNTQDSTLQVIDLGERAVQNVALSHDGSKVAVLLWGSDGVRVYRTLDGGLLGEDRSLASEGYGVAFAPDDRLAVSSLDGTVRLYGPDMQLRQSIVFPPRVLPAEVAFSPDGSELAVGRSDVARVVILNGADLILKRELFVTPENGSLTHVAWTPDGRAVLAAGRWRDADGLYGVARWQEGQGAATIPLALPEPITRLLATQDGQPMALNARGAVVVGQPKGARTMVHPRDGKMVPINALELGADGQAPRLNGKPIPLEVGERVTASAIAADGESVLLGSEWLLRSFTNKGRLQWSCAVPGTVRGVGISGNGRMVVTAYADRTLRWSDARTGDELLALYTEPESREWVAWTPEGFYDASEAGGRLAGFFTESNDFIALESMRGLLLQPAVLDWRMNGEETAIRNAAQQLDWRWLDNGKPVVKKRQKKVKNCDVYESKAK